MKALILAAGQGKRLWPLSNSTPKALLSFGSTTILEHQVKTLNSFGIHEICAVVGFGAEQIRKRCGSRLTYVENQDFSETNSLYSFWLARDFVDDDLIVLNSDVLFHPAILDRLLCCADSNVLAVEFRDSFEHEDMKLLLNGSNRVIAISKEIDGNLAMAENVGLLKLSKTCADFLLAQIEPVIQELRQKFFPYALNLIAPDVVLNCIDFNGMPWIEIDFPSDYERAKQVVYPRIVSSQDAGKNIA